MPSLSADQLLHVSHLQVTLGEEVILDDLSFDLSRNETLVILGPNGAGKTVLLRTLLGLHRHSGVVEWKENVRVGYVPQRVTFDKSLPITVEDFFSLKSISKDPASVALREVGLQPAELLKKNLGILSSGQFQRVLIAWSLAKDPDVLLFDEPTTGIDVGGEETIHSLLSQTQKERRLAVILVTHDLSAVYSHATQVLCLNKKVSCYGPPEKILDPKVLEQVYGKHVKYISHSHD